MTPSASSLPSTKAFTTHSSFSEVIPLYDGFILDQFGVMHNGSFGLEGAPECVKHLHSIGKKLIILSNTSSSSKATLEKLPKLGFDPIHFHGAVTSGEEASVYITDEYGSKKSKALWITWESPKVPSPMDFISKCGDIGIADDIDEAEFIIAHGVDVVRGKGEDGVATETSLGGFHENGSFEIIDPILEKCKSRGLPMVCANPDFIMVKADGSIGHMPGKIAQRYESIGGKCIYFGKPHVPHFEACLRELGLEKTRVAHVGDSIHHDIAGANATGIASVFVAGGVHREKLGSKLGELPETKNLCKLFEGEGHTPTHVIPMLRLD